jgi:hypothetical protein
LTSCLLALLATLLIELFLLIGMWAIGQAIATRRSPGSLQRNLLATEASSSPGAGLLTASLLVAGLNLISHPLAWLALVYNVVGFFNVELLVIIFEGLGLWLLPNLSLPKSLLLSLLLNLGSLSAVFGLIRWFPGFL